MRNGKGMFGLVLVLIFFASALFAPQLAPHDPFHLNIPARNSGPTIDYFVGTDQLGRDTFSRVLYGGRVALKIAAIGVRVRHWIAFHGISINVEPDLSHFDTIVPCGISDSNLTVTSLVDLGLPVSMADLDVAIMAAFEDVFAK